MRAPTTAVASPFLGRGGPAGRRGILGPRCQCRASASPTPWAREPAEGSSNWNRSVITTAGGSAVAGAGQTGASPRRSEAGAPIRIGPHCPEVASYGVLGRPLPQVGLFSQGRSPALAIRTPRALWCRWPGGDPVRSRGGLLLRIGGPRGLVGPWKGPLLAQKRWTERGRLAMAVRLEAWKGVFGPGANSNWPALPRRCPIRRFPSAPGGR